MEKPAIYIVTGIMASGKSTVAELLSKQFQKGVHVRGDVYRRMVTSGREEMSPCPSHEALRQLELRYRLAAHTADAYREAGFTVAVQDNILGEWLPRFLSFLHTSPLYLIVLCPRAEEVAKREMTRSKKGYGAFQVEQFDAQFRAETPRLGLWLDTTELTPEETVAAILSRREEALIRPDGNGAPSRPSGQETPCPSKQDKG